MPVITSLLNTDLYKISMQNFVFSKYKKTKASYSLINRGKTKFSNVFIEKFKSEIENICSIKLNEKEKQYLISLNLFTKEYIDFLENYRFDKNELKIKFTNNDLLLEIEGDWASTILWEVPLMALICEINYLENNMDGLVEKEKNNIIKKFNTLNDNGCKFIEFGTRRRKSSRTHSEILDLLIYYSKNNENSSFLGTSNVFFSMEKKLKCFGTYAHEIPMAMQSLHGVEKSNFVCLQEWNNMFPTLKMALTDTLTTNYFLKTFCKGNLHNIYDGVRQDSGDPFLEGEKIISFYEKNGIDPLTKKILFSDALDPEKCVKLNKKFSKKINVFFGIGTDLISKFNEVPPLNIVIKLKSINGVGVVKLSDDVGKVCGENNKIENVNKIINYSE